MQVSLNVFDSGGKRTISTFCTFQLRIVLCCAICIQHVAVQVVRTRTYLKHGFFSRSTISREKFEELCADIWEKALTPLKEVLEHSGLKTDEIHAVELIGGATRVPKLQVSSILLPQQ